MSGLGGFAIEVVVKAMLLLAAAAGASQLLRRGIAAGRHRVWIAAIVSVAVLPLVVGIAPRWTVRMLPAPQHRETVPAAIGPGDVFDTPLAPGLRGPAATTGAETPVRTPSILSEKAGSGADSEVAGAAGPDLAQLIAWLWLVGFGASLAWLLCGALTLRAIAVRAERVDDEGWRRLLSEEARLAKVDRSVRLLRSPVAGAPMTWGIGEPRILLPMESDGWPVERRRVVLRHELAHVARRDSLTQLIAGGAGSLYWFHPMMWWAIRRLRVERERACDERVLAAGTPAASYAAHLLEIARGARLLRLSSAVSLPLTRPSELESRLRLLFEPRSADRPRSRTIALGAWAGGVLMALALAAFRPVATIPGAAAGSDEPANADAEDERFGSGRRVEPTALGTAYESSPISAARSPEATQQVYEVRDSAGVRIVQYALVPERAAPFRLSAQPIFRVEAAPDGQPFEIPGAAALLTDGGAVLENGEARELVFISPAGSVAVRGTEPVPGAGIFSITPIEGDTILVQWTSWREPGELALLHRGELVRTVPLNEEVATNKVIGVARDGSLLLGLPSSLALGRPGWASAYLARYDRRAELVDTVGAYDLGGPHFPFRFPQNGAAAVSSGRFVIGRSDRPELRWFDPDGSLRQVLRWEKRPLVVSDSMWSVYEASYRAGVGRREAEDWIQRHLEGVKQSTDEAPVFRRVLSDSEGNVWIGSHGFPLEYWTPAGYDVISEQGVWLGTVPVPSNFRVLAVGSDRVLGVEVEGQQVLGVVMYRLQR